MWQDNRDGATTKTFFNKIANIYAHTHAHRHAQRRARTHTMAHSNGPAPWNSCLGLVCNSNCWMPSKHSFVTGIMGEAYARMSWQEGGKETERTNGKEREKKKQITQSRGMKWKFPFHNSTEMHIKVHFYQTQIFKHITPFILVSQSNILAKIRTYAYISFYYVLHSDCNEFQHFSCGSVIAKTHNRNDDEDDDGNKPNKKNASAFFILLPPSHIQVQSIALDDSYAMRCAKMNYYNEPYFLFGWIQMNKWRWMQRFIEIFAETLHRLHHFHRFNGCFRNL